MIPLASNENPLGMPASARRAAADALAGSALYPDGTGTELKAALSARLDVPADWLTLGNGSCEILTLAAQTCVQPGQGVVWSQYGFLVYGQAAALVGARRSVVPAQDFGHDLDAMRAAVDADTRLVFVANPNNPTGTLLDPARLHAFIAGLPEQVTVLLDEAYTEYLTPDQRYDSMAWVRQHPNLIVARTFSKAYGLAGLRIGYGVAQAALSSKLNTVRPRFNVTTPAMAAARAALDDADFLQRTYSLNLAVRSALAEGLTAEGLTVWPSAGNFLMVQFPDAPAMVAHLRAEGIAVSALAPYGLPSWLRITTGLPEHNRALLSAIARGLRPT